MFCSISGEVPTEPVISKKTGHLYEKGLIDKYIREQGKCPVSGQELNESDLLPVLANKAVRPRAVATAGIPGLLGMLQNEWDELMLETYTLRQHLSATRQELSQALYQHDAACRVIARLLRERDEARALALNNNDRLTASEASPSSTAAGLSAELLAAMESKCEELSKARKARGKNAPPNLAPASDLSHFAEVSNLAPMSGAVTALTVRGEDIAAGSADGTVAVNGNILKGHQGSISGVCFASKNLFSSSSDGSVKIWSAGKCSHTFSASAESSPITSMRSHPTDALVACTLHSGGYSLIDVSRGSVVVRTSAEHLTVSGDLHPDGLLLAGGAVNGTVAIWDLRTQAQVASLSHVSSAISSLRFSENGYHLGGSSGNSALLWDMRKLALAKELQVTAPVSSVAFDNSGTYFAFASGSAINAMVVKEWSSAMDLSNAMDGTVSAVAWGADARSLVAGGGDGALKMFGLSN